MRTLIHRRPAVPRVLARRRRARAPRTRFLHPVKALHKDISPFAFLLVDVLENVLGVPQTRNLLLLFAAIYKHDFLDIKRMIDPFIGSGYMLDVIEAIDHKEIKLAAIGVLRSACSPHAPDPATGGWRDRRSAQRSGL